MPKIPNRVGFIMKILISSILILVFFSFCDPPPKSMEVQVGETNESSTQATEPESKEKSDEEVIKETVQALVTIGENVIKNKKEKDSIRIANREQLYAYRIGLPINDIDEVFEAYKALNETDNIYVLKQSKRDYYLVYYDGSGKQQLEDSLESFKTKLPDTYSNHISVINIIDLCIRSKEKLMVGEKLTKRKEEVQIPCLTCEK